MIDNDEYNDSTPSSATKLLQRIVHTLQRNSTHQAEIDAIHLINDSVYTSDILVQCWCDILSNVLQQCSTNTISIRTTPAIQYTINDIIVLLKLLLNISRCRLQLIEYCIDLLSRTKLSSRLSNDIITELHDGIRLYIIDSDNTYNNTSYHILNIILNSVNASGFDNNNSNTAKHIHQSESSTLELLPTIIDLTTNEYDGNDNNISDHITISILDSNWQSCECSVY